MEEDDQPISQSRGKACRDWWRALATISPACYRVLVAAAGVVGLLAVANFLPFTEPFLVPPYPTQYHRSWNFFALIPHPVWSYCVFALSVGASLCLIRGLWVRRSALFLLLFMSGIITSARPLTSSASSVFCLLMLFIALSPAPNEKGERCGWAIFGLRLQAFLIYFCGVLFKMADPAWVQGFPMPGTLIGMSWSSGFGVWVSQVVPVSLLNIIGQLTLGIEALAPIAVFIFYRVETVRRAGVFLLMVMHLSMALLMTLEIFPWVMLALLLVFWDEAIVRKVSEIWLKLKSVSSGKLREWTAALCVLVIALLALGQTFLPALGIKVPWVDLTVAALNRQMRFDQHWGMFTNTSFEVNEERRRKPDKSYKTTRLLIRTVEGEFWDPFTGRMSSLKRALLEGSSHPHSSRKAVSYIYKSNGAWQKRGLRTMAQWALEEAEKAGQVVEAVVIYRYSMAVDFSKSLHFSDLVPARARLWYRLPVSEGKLGLGEEISPSSIRAISINLAGK